MDFGPFGLELFESRIAGCQKLNIPVQLQERVDVSETFGNSASFRGTIADPHQCVATLLHLVGRECFRAGEAVHSKPTLANVMAIGLQLCTARSCNRDLRGVVSALP